MTKKIVLVAAIIIISAAGWVKAAETSKIDILKGESWWGIFVSGGQMMPLSLPFAKIDLADRRGGQTTPMLISSRGRYIWSKDPFSIEFTGDAFNIEANQKIEAVTGGKTLREAYLVCCHTNFPPSGQTPAPELFSLPIYDMSVEYKFGPTENQVHEYANKILETGYPVGTILIPSGWQQSIGQFEPNKTLYPHFATLVNEMHAKGFKIMLTINPFISGDGEVYQKTHDSEIFIKQSAKPVIAQWDGGYSAIYDVTNPKVFETVHSQLNALRSETKIDGYLFDCEAALPNIRHASRGSSEYLTRWSELSTGCDFSQYTISRSGSFAPYVHDLRVSNKFDWEFIKKSLSNIITANMLGYPYSSVNADMTHRKDNTPIDEKLLLRYTQLTSVLPVMNIRFAPWNITDQKLAEHCKRLINGRTNMGEYYDKLVKECAKTAEPIIRHMEYEFPRNGFTDCDDQFMIGSKYLIAPLLTESDSRMVRFPKGIWTDSTGKKYKGPLVTTITSVDGEILIFESAKQ